MFRWQSDRWLCWISGVCAAVSGLAALFISCFLVKESLPALRHVGVARFLTDDSWRPAMDAQSGTFNLMPMLAATMACTLGAVLVSAPLGLGSALFIRFYAPRFLVGPFRRIVELLAGIPSVVYGFWGLVVLVPIINSVHPPGASLLAGVLILSLMILPTLALMADAAIAGIPFEHLQGAAALGLSKAATIEHVVLPSIRPTLAAGILLQAGRALGETMAVLMVCGNAVRWPTSLFQSVRPLTSNIALEMAYAMGDHRSALFVSGLALLAGVVLIVIAADILLHWRSLA